MKRKKLIATLGVATAFGALASTAPAATVPPLELFYQPTVTQVSDRAKATIAPFRETDPVTVPEIVKLYGAADPATGKTLLGMNVAFARPAYTFGKSGKPHFWLAPSAGDTVAAFEFDSKGREVEDGGLNAPIDKKFEKHGYLDWTAPSPGSKQKRTEIRALVPDSIKSFKIITKRNGKKSLTKRYKIQGNSIILDLKNPSYIVLGGKKTKIDEANPGDSLEFDGDYFQQTS